MRAARFLLAVGAAGLAGSVSAIPAQASLSDTVVRMVDYGFGPDRVVVDAGTTVRWTNTGKLPHDVVDRGGTFDTQPILPGESDSITFTVPGTYSYLCRIHPDLMKGTVEVRGAGPEARVNRVEVTEFSYQPREIAVATGSLVLVANVGGLPHTMTAEDGTFDTGVITPGPQGGRFAGTNVSFTVTKPGRYPFICNIHPDQMRGVLEVTGPPRAGPAVASSAPRKAGVDLVDFAMKPVQTSVAPGGTITFTNAGQSPHTATFDEVDLDTKELDPGRSGDLTAPMRPGSYSYHCEYHPTQMRGVLVVVGPGETDPTRTKAGRAALAEAVKSGGGGLSYLALVIGVLAALLGGFAISAFARNRWGAE